jgi:hypothetical protein
MACVLTIWENFVFEISNGNHYKAGFNRGVAKIMADDRICSDCGHSRHCSEVHEHVGEAGGGSVARVSLIAFVLPIVVFLVSLVLLQGFFGSGPGLTAVFCGMGAAAAFGSVLFGKTLIHRVSKRR